MKFTIPLVLSTLLLMSCNGSSGKAKPGPGIPSCEEFQSLVGSSCMNNIVEITEPSALQACDGELETSATMICKHPGTDELIDNTLCDVVPESLDRSLVSPAGNKLNPVSNGNEVTSCAEGESTGTVSLSCDADFRDESGSCVPGVIGLSGGYSYSCATYQDGSVKCSGYQVYGTNGSYPTSMRTPELTPHLVGETLFTGGDNACSINSDSEVSCSGQGGVGRLGNGDSNLVVVHTNMPHYNDSKFVAIGYYHTCVIKNDDTVHCSGRNNNFELGDGSGSNQSTPVVVAGFQGATKLFAGEHYTCALMSDSKVKCAGGNYFGRFGSTLLTDIDVETPVVIPELENAKQLVFGGGSHICYIAQDDKAYCGGFNTLGQLGDGTNVSKPFVEIPDFENAKKLVAGENHTCALFNDNSVKCTGLNTNGQLGIGNTANQNTPVVSPGFAAAKDIFAGRNWTCIITNTAQLKCAGENISGQLGFGVGSPNTISTPALTLH